MAALLLLVFLAIVALDMWAAIAVMFKPGLSGWLGASYWIVALLAVAGAIGMTGFFSYYSNPNTHVFGWPIPRVVFQREHRHHPGWITLAPRLCWHIP